MSWALEEWAAGLKLPATQKTILRELCKRANAFGECWPSQVNISERTGICIRAVRNALKALDERGYIARERRQKGYIKHSDKYTILSPILAELVRENSAENSAKISGGDAPEKSESCAENSGKNMPVGSGTRCRYVPARDAAANESSSENPFERLGEAMKIFEKNIFSGDRGGESNPWAYQFANFSLTILEYDAICAALPYLGDDRIYDLLCRHDDWLARPENITKPWLPCLLKYLEMANATAVDAARASGEFV